MWKKLRRRRPNQRMQILERRLALTAPVAVEDEYALGAGETAELFILANDTDADGDTLFIVETSEPFLGTVELGSDSVIYSTTEDSGTDGFSYTVSDGNGETSTSSVTIFIGDTNAPPNPMDDAHTTDSDPYIVHVLDNDTDPNGDSLSLISVSMPQHGRETTIQGETILYRAEPQFTGTDEFTYTVSDGNGATNTATVTLHVEGILFADNDAAVAESGETITIDVLANDVGQNLEIDTVSPADHGQATLNGQAIDYTAPADFTGVDEFFYSIRDDTGNTSVASVTVTVSSGEPLEFRGLTVNDESTGLVTNPPPIGEFPAPTTWAMQRSDLRLISLEFNEPVQATIGDLQLINLGVNADVDPDQEIDLVEAQATLHLTGNFLTLEFPHYALPDGVYQINVPQSVTGQSGALLETPLSITGDAQNRFYKLAADWNGDRSVTVFDVSTLAYWFGTSVPNAPHYVDCSGDNGISVFDVPCLAGNFSARAVYPAAARSILNELAVEAHAPSLEQADGGQVVVPFNDLLFEWNEERFEARDREVVNSLDKSSDPRDVDEALVADDLWDTLLQDRN